MRPDPRGSAPNQSGQVSLSRIADLFVETAQKLNECVRASDGRPLGFLTIPRTTGWFDEPGPLYYTHVQVFAHLVYVTLYGHM